MKGQAIGILTAVAVIISAIAASSQTASPGAPASIDGLVSAARSAAGLDWPGTFMRLCIVPAPAAGGGGRGAGVAPPGPPARDTWYAEPAKVAHNVYYFTVVENCAAGAKAARGGRKALAASARASYLSAAGLFGAGGIKSATSS